MFKPLTATEPSALTPSVPTLTEPFALTPFDDPEPDTVTPFPEASGAKLSGLASPERFGPVFGFADSKESVIVSRRARRFGWGAGVFVWEEALVVDEALEVEDVEEVLGVVAGRFTEGRMLVSEAMGVLLEQADLPCGTSNFRATLGGRGLKRLLGGQAREMTEERGGGGGASAGGCFGAEESCPDDGSHHGDSRLQGLLRIC
jgi:hypothetical protein